MINFRTAISDNGMEITQALNNCSRLLFRHLLCLVSTLRHNAKFDDDHAHVDAVPSRQQRIHCQQVDSFHQNDIKLFAVPSGFLAFVVALEAVGVLNLPHSDSREAYRESRQQQGRRGARLSSPQWSRHWEPAARMAAPCPWQCAPS